jgi:hypothetical protein
MVFKSAAWRPTNKNQMVEVLGRGRMELFEQPESFLWISTFC